MKTTIDLPDTTLKQAQTLAQAQGISIEQLLAKALEEAVRLRSEATRRGEPPWMKLAGAFGRSPADRAETRRIQEVIDREFERIEPEDRQ